jgi:hypothetical protein
VPVVAGALALGWGGGACDVCAGSGRLSTRPTGAACEGEIEPVVSLFLFELSPNRVASPLQAATPRVSNARTAARGHDRERNSSCTQNIATHSYATRNTERRLNTRRVNKTLSNYARSTLPK